MLRTKRMKKIIRNILFFVILIVILIITLFGLSIAKNTLVSPVGLMQIASFDNGISLFQNDRGTFYAFSPFNDYYVENGDRTSLISFDEIEGKKYKNNLEKSKFEQLSEMFKSYFRLDTPSLSYFASTNSFYDTQIIGNKLTITKKVSGIESNVENIQAFTLPFNSNDFVFDSNSNLYTYIPDRQLHLFELIYEKTLTPQLDELEIIVPSKTLYIYNTQMAGLITINASNSQTIKINRNAKLIEIEENISPNKGIYTQQLQIAILDNPKKI